MANEMRLIDATALLKALQGKCGGNYAPYQLVMNAPTVDAVEVVHGHWHKAPHHPYRCSCCGEMALLDMYGESHVRSNYCPRCGAKMDGDGNG